MSKILTVVAIFVIQSLFSCRTSKTESPQASKSPDSLKKIPDSVRVVDSTPPLPMKLPQPTTIKPNLSFIGAQVDSVVLIDDYNYRLYIFAGTSIDEADKANLLEPGQRIVVEPQYVRDAKGGIDLTNSINKKLYRLRTKKPKEVFIGWVSLVPQRGWMLVNIEVE